MSSAVTLLRALAQRARVALAPMNRERLGEFGAAIPTSYGESFATAFANAHRLRKLFAGLPQLEAQLAEIARDPELSPQGRAARSEAIARPAIVEIRQVFAQLARHAVERRSALMTRAAESRAKTWGATIDPAERSELRGLLRDLARRDPDGTRRTVTQALQRGDAAVLSALTACSGPTRDLTLRELGVAPELVAAASGSLREHIAPADRTALDGLDAALRLANEACALLMGAVAETRRSAVDDPEIIDFARELEGLARLDVGEAVSPFAQRERTTLHAVDGEEPIVDEPASEPEPAA